MSDAIESPDVTIDINGERIGAWSGLTINRQIDAAADAFSFSLPWDPTDRNRDLFRPFSPTIIDVFNKTDRLISGYIEVVRPTTGPAQRMLNLQGRSATGVLVDWSAGPPFEFQGLTFNAIARAISRQVFADGSQAVQYDVRAFPDTGVLADVSVDVGQLAYAFISSLAKANGLWAQPQTTGALRFSRIDSKRQSVADLVEGESPLISASASYDVTKRFQRYIVIAQDESDPLAQYEIGDPETLGLGIRGTKIIELRQESAELRQAAQMAVSAALIDSFGVTVVLTGWRNDDRLWRPADIVRLLAPGAYVVKLSRLIVRRVSFGYDETGGEISTMELTLPEAYDQRQPEEFPWVE